MKSLKNCNHYTSYIYAYNKEGQLVRHNNTACLAGVQSYKKGTTIYLKDFEREETYKYIKSLMRVINKITPCEVVKIDKDKYISFKLFGTYDQNLAILNFVRNLWYSPSADWYDHFKADLKKNYFYVFFETLKKSRLKDPLKKLTTANVAACKVVKSQYSIGHGNVHPSHKIKVKTLEQLKKFKGKNLENFFCKE